MALEDGVLVAIGRIYNQLGSYLRKVKKINVINENVTAEPRCGPLFLEPPNIKQNFTLLLRGFFHFHIFINVTSLVVLLVKFLEVSEGFLRH